MHDPGVEILVPDFDDSLNLNCQRGGGDLVGTSKYSIKTVVYTLKIIIVLYQQNPCAIYLTLCFIACSNKASKEQLY